MLLEYAHRKTKHGGVQVTSHFIRQCYWIPKLRSELRQHIHKCVVCARLNAIYAEQLMAELLEERISQGKPFIQTGVDYAGPFITKLADNHGNVLGTHKVWIAVFVCLKTRAVHLEVVSGESSIAFIDAFEKFIGRRSYCKKMFSDNGKNFVGADSAIRKAMDSWLEQATIDHLKRVMGLQVLEHGQFVTLITQIEAILNSRPIHPLSDDPDDISALTPGHFLVVIVPASFEVPLEGKSVGVKLFKERQKLLNNFWQRWKDDYLHTLQERKKWRKEKENLKIGQLVLLAIDKFPPAAWIEAWEGWTREDRDRQNRDQ